MRVLLTCDRVGGVWQYATDLASGLLPLGIEPVLVTMGPRPKDAQPPTYVELVETDLPLDWLAASPHEVAKAGHELARLADRLRVDLVQLNAPAYAADVRFSQPVLAVAHSCVGTWWQAVRGGRIDPDLAWRAELTGAGLRAADRVAAPSASFAAALQHCYGLSEAPAVAHNGRRPAALSGGNAPLFAFTAGRLWDEGKNVRVLETAAKGMSVPIRAAGPALGPNGSTIELRHVQALGQLSGRAIAEQLAARPIFVSSALYEPFGLAVLEAAQAGCALVVSDIPTFRELWDGAARFVYPHDFAGFARAIEEVAADAGLRERLGAAARSRSSRYTVERMAADMFALYVGLPCTSKPLPFRGGVGVGQSEHLSLLGAQTRAPTPVPSPEGEGLMVPA